MAYIQEARHAACKLCTYQICMTQPPTPGIGESMSKIKLDIVTPLHVIEAHKIYILTDNMLTMTDHMHLSCCYN